MILEALTLKQKLISGLIAAVVVGALLFAFWSVAWGKGFTSGALSNAKPLAECRTELATIKEAQNALHTKNESLKAEAVKAKDDAAAAWDHASSIKPRVVRVRNCPANGDGKAPEDRDTGKPADVAGEPGVGATGVVAEELSIEEINRRLNAAEKAAGQLAHLISAVRTQQGIYK